MSRFKELLRGDKFLVTVEASPPKGSDVDGFVHVLETLSGKIDAMNFPDSKGARIHMNSIASALIARDKGIEPIITFSCRDRNRVAMNSELIGCSALGLNSILCVSGDYVTFGDAPQAKPVYDLDSVQTIQMIRNCEKGIDIGGNSLQGEMSFCVGCVANPLSDPLEVQLIKLEKKISAGIDFIQTMDIYDLNSMKAFFEHLKDKDVKVLAGVRLVTKRDVELCNARNWPNNDIPQEYRREILEAASEDNALNKAREWLLRLITEIKESGICSGVHISAEGNETLIPEILASAGID